MFEAERDRVRQIWRKNALAEELAGAEDRERMAEIKGGEHMRLLTYNRWYLTTLIYSVDRMVR